MALNYDNLSALTKDQYIPNMVDNIKKSNVLTMRLLGASKPTASGNKVLQPVEYARQTAKGFYSGYDVLDTSPTEVFTDAQYDWVQAYGTITISGKEEALNDGKERVIDLLEAKVKNMEVGMKELFGETLYGSGTGTDGKFVGLQHLIKVDRTLGGIDSTSYSWWDGGYIRDAGSNSGVSGSVATYAETVNVIESEMRQAFGSLTKGSDSPTMIVTTQIIFDALEEALSDQKRFAGSTAGVGDHGFMELKYRGIPVFVDEHCPAGQMYFLNENYLGFRHHRKRDFAFEGFQKPVNQDARIAKIFWLGALTCSNPSRQGMIDDLAESY
tara:strand:- start:382 stop:1362 length:981 start_codon:yes stop_codon:yes gene_type:complete